MRQFLKDLWYGEPAVVLGLLGTGLVAYVGFGDPPRWAAIAAVIVQALAGFYARSITQPFRVDQLSDPRLTVPARSETGRMIPVPVTAVAVDPAEIAEDAPDALDEGAATVTEALVIAILIIVLILLWRTL